MIISLQNIENLLVDKSVQDILPEFSDKFKALKTAKMSGLYILAQQTSLQVLNELNGEHLSRLEKHFQEKIILKKTSTTVCNNYVVNINETEDLLSNLDFQGNLSISREGDLLYLSVWR